MRFLTTDGRLLFATRLVRLFAYGFLSVVLALYLAQVGLTTTQIGLLFTFTLIGDAGISLDQRTRVLAWYNLVGSFATATGALVGGAVAQGLQAAGSTPLESYRAIVIGYRYRISI